MSPGPEPQISAEQVGEKQEDLSWAVGEEAVAVQQQEAFVEEITASVAVVERTQENRDSSGLDTKKTTGKETIAAPRTVESGLDTKKTAGKEAVAAPTNVEDMDEELLQEQAQAVVEELQKRGACTTLALAKMLGMEKSTQLNPLLYLLLEKNVVVRVTDFPPIWSLSPTFPMSFLSSASAAPVLHAAAPVPVAVPAPNPVSPASVIPSASPPPYTSVQLQPNRIMAKQPQAVNRHPAAGTIITFPPIPAERTTKPVITFPPIPADPKPPSESASQPATSGTMQQQHQSADYWQSLSQISGGKNNRNGGTNHLLPGGGPTFSNKKWKKQKNLTELQVRLLKELKERGPTRTLELSKIVGLVTCRDVNPSIYDLKQRNLVVKVNNAPPVWQLKEPGMNRAQFEISGMEVDEDEDQSEREIQPGASFGRAPMTVNSQGISSVSFFH